MADSTIGRHDSAIAGTTAATTTTTASTSTTTTTSTRAMFDAVMEHNNLGVTQLHAGHHREAVRHFQCAIQSLRNLVQIIKQTNPKLPPTTIRSSRSIMMSMNYNWMWFSAQSCSSSPDDSSYSDDSSSSGNTNSRGDSESSSVDNDSGANSDDDDDDNGFVFQRALWISSRMSVSNGAKQTRISSVTNMSTLIVFNMGLAFHSLGTGASSTTTATTTLIGGETATPQMDDSSLVLPASALDNDDHHHHINNNNNNQWKAQMLQSALRCYRASVDIRNKSNQVNSNNNNNQKQEYHRHYHRNQHQLILFDLALLNNIAVIHRKLRDYKEALVWYRTFSQTVHGLHPTMVSLVMAHNDSARYYFVRMMASCYYRWHHSRGAAAA